MDGALFRFHMTMLFLGKKYFDTHKCLLAMTFFPAIDHNLARNCVRSGPTQESHAKQKNCPLRHSARRSRLVAGLALLFSVTCGLESGLAQSVSRARQRTGEYVSLGSVAAKHGLKQMASGGKEFRFQGGGISMIGSVGSRIIIIEGARVNLSHPVAAGTEGLAISRADAGGIVEPLLAPRNVPGPRRIQTVVIDPGHGGHDTGARGRFGLEKDHALDTAKRLERLLKASGYRVVMTRSDDRFITLDQRAALASRYPNAVFISIHFNKGRASASGIETFALASPGVRSMNHHHGDRGIAGRHPGNRMDGANALLAATVHSELAKRIKTIDRGVKFARFRVLRYSTSPAILVEGGFMSHAVEGRAISQPAYRERLAQSIAEGVRLYQQRVSHGYGTAKIASRRGSGAGLLARLFGGRAHRESSASIEPEVMESN